MKILCFIGIVISLMNFGKPNLNPTKLNITDGDIDLERRTMKYDSINGRNLTIEFTWSPKNKIIKKSIEDSTYNVDYLHKRKTKLEIQDISEISLNTNYKIPSDNIKVESIFYGLFSNFELYKNLKGQIRFKELTDHNTKFEILLSGELNEIIKFKYDTILNEEIKIHDN